MKVFAVLFALFALSKAEFKVDKEDEGVLVLDEGNFDAALAAHPSGILVEFYAPWCGHCKKLAPEYKKAAKTLLENDPPLRIGMVDATEEKSLAEKFGVRGFPTLKFFRNSEPADYEGGRTARDIVNFMKKKTGPPTKALESKANLEKLMESNEVIVAGFFPNMESEEAKVFLNVASSKDEIEFFHTSEAGLIADAEENSLVVLKQFDEKRNDMTITAKTSVAEAGDFVDSMSLPKLIEFSQERTKQIFHGAVKIHSLTFIDKEASYAKKIMSTLESVADTHRGEMLHIYVPSSEDRVMSYFGFSKDDLPKTVIADMRSDGAMKKYIFDGKDLSHSKLVKFEKDFFQGSLSPTLKSEDDTPSNMKGPVKVITGKSFEKNVVGSGKDVLLEFYAPWCGHCKALAPKFDELGEKFEDVDSVMIAKMDATANEIDHPDVGVRGFPTLYFFPGDGSTPQQYEGAREVDDMVKFLRAHATQDFDTDGVKGGPSFRDEL